MPLYDPSRCPDCRSDLSASPTRCPVCELPLTGRTAVQLQSALQYADQLVAQLRRPTPVVAAPYPAPAPRARPDGRGLRLGSVPAVLLGLGALCLLVAATVFLAVAWSGLGLGGRTVVLLALTAASGVATLWLGGRGLLVAAEAFGVVTLGLVLVDVAGADRAGWVPVSASGYGAVLLAAALLLVLHPLRLVAAQVAAVVGVAVAALGLAGDLDADLLVAILAVLVLAALVEAGRFLGVRVLPVLAGVAAGWSWAVVATLGLERASYDLTALGMWRDGGARGLLVATALLVLPALHLRGSRPVVLSSVAGACLLLTGTLALPVVDESLTALLVAAVVAVAGWSVVAVVLPRRWVAVPAAPLAVVGVPLLAGVGLMTAAALGRVLTVGEPFSRAVDVRLGAWDGPHPALLGIGTLALVLAAVSLAPAPHRRRIATYGAVPLVIAALAMPALLAAPLAVVLAAALTAAALACLAGRGAGWPLAGLGTAVGVLTAALPSAVLTAGAAGALTVLAAVLTVRGTSVVGRVGGAVLPLALAATVGAVGQVGGLDPSYRSLAALALVGLLALVLPRIEIEIGAAVVGLLAATLGITGSDSLAVHLTLAGALLSASALVHRDRRLLAWPGGLLLAAATWVRLGEIGVRIPEPYTLPTALALLLVGLHRLVRDGRTATARTLLPGLLLAVVPSLAWALADPLSPRAALVGAACLGLALLGARMLWAAPLLVGGLAGAALVLREAAPYLAATPQWVLLGTAGAVLTTVGITWERRLVDLRRAGSYVTRLR